MANEMNRCKISRLVIEYTLSSKVEVSGLLWRELETNNREGFTCNHTYLWVASKCAS